MKKIAFASHVSLINNKEYDGIGNVLIETLNDIPANYIFVRHSMDGRLRSVVRHYKDSIITKEYKLAVLSKPAPIRYISEIFCTVYYFLFSSKIDIFIGIDPLNALAGVILKKLHRIDKCIFYTPDYSPQRFTNNLLNNIYHYIDNYCVKNADEVWSVSTRIQAIRNDQGLAKEKNILIPNVPPTKYSYLGKNKRNKYALITSGIIDKQLDFKGVIDAMKIAIKDYPKLEFVIVGNGPKQKEIQDYANKLGLGKSVKFLGHLPLEKSLEAISKSGIGLSLYTGDWGFNYYGDSTKCREFAFFGLPIITTNTHSTVDQIERSGAGVIVKKDTNEYVKTISTILDDYDSFSKKSFDLGKKYEGIHEKLLLDLFRN